MAVFKCKMCGGNLEVVEGQNIGTCDSCGSTMTLPKANDERVLNLFNRATHYRQQNEFDKAIATYESILEEDSENAEAYWGLVLSKYGIEYVEDPKTHKRIPTCHRLQHESILSDLDYKSALKYALDHEAERLYTEEANRIAEIQKNILSVANKEEAYDIFICYKETDISGRRTMDSVLAQDIYSQLTNEGYKVFFSRITLEDKLGAEYEPYIFAALNSAKIMLVVGTDRGNFNAVWVKNEWSRFLALSKKDKDKRIIPCYRDMDAYDLPEELSMFQSQDMNKIGFMQDLLRGINKLLSSKAENPNTTAQQVHDYKREADSMLKRAFLLLEYAEWEKANQLFEDVLKIEPENAKAYLGKLMIEIKVRKSEDLAAVPVDFSNSVNYEKAVRFADDKLKQSLTNYCNASKKLKEDLDSEIGKLQEEYKAIRKKHIFTILIRYIVIVFCIFMMFATTEPSVREDSAIWDFLNTIFMILGILSGGGLVAAPLIPSKARRRLDKLSIKMLLTKNKYDQAKLDDDTKKILTTIQNEEKGVVSVAHVNKVCGSLKIKMDQDHVNKIVNTVKSVNKPKPSTAMQNK